MIRDRLPSGTQIVENHDWLEQTFDLDHTGAAVTHPDIHCRKVVMTRMARHNNYIRRERMRS